MIMKTEFTPGKWEIKETENWFDVLTDNGDRITSIDKSDILYSFSDARLIASAPELFELCVFIAHEEGWQWAYDIISNVLGEKVTLSDVTELHESYNKK